MKQHLLVLAVLVMCAWSVRPPAPFCRPSPLPSIIPVSIGETARLDLEYLFDGYNLVFDGLMKQHIEITPKYTVNHSDFEHSFNFSSAKIKEHNRFLGLSVNNEFTTLAIGLNHPESGIVIEKVVEVENRPELHCYDVDEIIDYPSQTAYAIIDCGLMRNGELHRNQFLFINLATFKILLGSRQSDVFVPYTHLKARKIEMLADPFTNIEYMFRFYESEGVDAAHADQTYVEIFLHTGQVMSIQILDVIDHTSLGLPSLAILDYQVLDNFIYLLVKDAGIYQIQLSPTQRVARTAFMPIKMNVNRFRVQRNGFNDDVYVVVSNDNTVYQYTWDLLNGPALLNKFSIIAGSVVEELLMDEDFVIVQAKAMIGTELQRRTWVFTRNTLSYFNAFGSFLEPSFGPSIIAYRPHDRTLHLIQQYKSYNIRLSLPYLIIRTDATSKAGDTESYLIKARSIGNNDTDVVECKQTINLIFIENTNTSIIKTGLQGRPEMLVDAPDNLAVDLEWEFFGRNISYNVSFQSENSTKRPQHYVEKKVKAMLTFPPEINTSNIVYYQIFAEDTLEQIQDRTQIFGIVQVSENTTYPIYYINCKVLIDAQFTNPSISCRTVTKSNLGLGKIRIMSQMYSPKQKIGAIVFDDGGELDVTVYLYYFYSTGFIYYGSKRFGYDYANLMSGVSVTMNNLVVVTFQYGKRVQVYAIDDLHHSREYEPQPKLTLDTRIMSIFGITYFAPLATKVSVYHPEVVFLKTKTGIFAFNVNDQGIPDPLFQIKTSSSRYDFQVNRNTLVLVGETEMALYRLTTPLRRSHEPLLLQKFQSDFNIKEYDEINSDGLFYLVEKEDNMLLVVHPGMPSTSVIYAEFFVGSIKMIDAVKINDKEVLMIWNGKEMLAYMFAENPILRVRWDPDQKNFTMNVSAYNEKSGSEFYTTKVEVIESNEAEIIPTEKFDADKIRKLGHVQTKKNSGKVDMNITLNDTQWFDGNVLHYNIKCKDCHEEKEGELSVSLQNHLKTLNTMIDVGEPTYDLHSTYLGIYGQQYNSIFKTFEHNDSIEYIVTIPTESRGEVCSKMAIDTDVVLSFCEKGAQVNMYVTTSHSFKPFTYGPFETEAKEVNHVYVAGNIVMIVDNSDDPFSRAGGIYLYYLDFTADSEVKMFTMLDYLDDADLQIQGFRGRPSIASAEIVKPIFNREQYVVFITEARTGSIFAFLFEVSNNKQEAVYLQRKVLDLNRMIPSSAKHPTPLRVININVIDYTIRNTTGKAKIQYVFLLTVKNWHHIELEITFDEDYDILFFELVRLYERVPYPWELNNFIRVRKGSLNASYFAVTYSDYTKNEQFLVIYTLPYFQLPAEERDKLRQQRQAHPIVAAVPVTKVLSAYRARGAGQICYDFNVRDEHRLLFNDVGHAHLSELELNKELKIIIKNAQPELIESENITIIAENQYTNFSFIVELSFTLTPDENSQTVEIIWIVILVIGFFMIVGLIFVWSKQSKPVQERDSIKESLLTVEPDFNPNYINRSSADPESLRGTVDYDATPAPTPTPAPAPQDPMEEELRAPQSAGEEETAERL